MASAHLNTTDEGEDEEEFDFNKWVTQNNLTDIKHLLTKHGMNTLSTLNTTSTQFQHLMSDPQLMAFMNNNIIPTIFSALKKIPKIDENKKSKIIVISEEEEESRNKLDEFNNNNKKLTTKLNETNDKLTINVKDCNAKIDKTFHILIQKINNKKNEIKQKLQNIDKKKKSIIYAKSQTLKKEQINIKNAIKTCNNLVQHGDMERPQRKKKIISITNDMKNANLSNDINDININVIYTFNEESISSFISNLADVYGEELHPIPSITKIECKGITQTEATVHFIASLSKRDMNKKTNSTLFMKIEFTNNDIDEKEKEALNSGMIQFRKNQSDYNYQIKSLTKNTNYAINVNLYESMNNNKQTTKRSDYKPVSVNFKTSSYEIDKHFKYQSDFDENGICYALGTGFGKSGYKNPLEKGVVKVKVSSRENGQDKDVVGRNTAVYCYTNDIANSWMMIDFGKYQILPTHYSLRNGWNDNSTYMIRNWRLEGSVDGDQWTSIKVHTNDTSITKAYELRSWQIDSKQYFTMFRIYSTGPCYSNTNYLMISGFEVYGHLRC